MLPSRTSALGALTISSASSLSQQLEHTLTGVGVWVRANRTSSVQVPRRRLEQGLVDVRLTQQRVNVGWLPLGQRCRQAFLNEPQQLLKGTKVHMGAHRQQSINRRDTTTAPARNRRVRHPGTYRKVECLHMVCKLYHECCTHVHVESFEPVLFTQQCVPQSQGQPMWQLAQQQAVHPTETKLHPLDADGVNVLRQITCHGMGWNGMEWKHTTTTSRATTSRAPQPVRVA